MSLMLMVLGNVLIPGTIMLGAILLQYGWRGRVINDHPWCKACGFDLFQRWPDAARCPECGTNLKSPGAVRHGQRAVRPKPLVIGAGLVSVGLIGLVLNFSVIFRDSLKPDWWLVFEANSGSPATEIGALDELNRRLVGGGLGSKDVRALVEDGLKCQADPERIWHFQWGDFIEAARKTGLVTDEQWRDYLRHTVSFRFEARPRVREGEGWILSLAHSRQRQGHAPRYLFRKRVMRVRTSGRSWPVHDSCGWQTWYGGGRSRQLLIPFGPGHYDIELDVQYDVADPLVIAAGGSIDPTDDIQPAARWQVTYSAHVEIVEPEESLVALIDDPALRETMAAFIKIHALRIATTTTSATPADSTQPEKVTRSLALMCHLRCEPGLPVGMAFDVFLRDETRRWHLGSGRLKPDLDYPGGCVFHTDPDDPDFADFNARHVDVILAPNTEIAEADSDFLEIWGREIVFEDVPVHWPCDVIRQSTD